MHARASVFGAFRLDSAQCTLTRSGVRVPITPKAFDLLELLVGGEGRVLLRETLMDALWPETVVSDATLSKLVFVLRQWLDPERSGPVWIETIAKRGYRFAGEVRREGKAQPIEARGASRHVPRRRVGALRSALIRRAWRGR